jgi:hypothetical protein
MTMFASHCGYFTSLMKPTSSNFCTSAFVAFTFSSAILQIFYFFSLALELTCSQCSMMSLLTPTKSKVDHANTLLFLSRKLSSFICSSWLASAPMHTILSGTLGSNGTFLDSPSTSMIFFVSCQRFYPVLVRLLSQKVYVLVSWHEALLNIFGFLLAAKNGYDAEGH